MELACVFDRTEQQIVGGLTEVYRRRNFKFYEVPLAPGNGWESEQSNEDLMFSAPSAVGTCILFEEYCEDLYEASEQLSAVLDASVLAAQCYKNYWGYDFFAGGKRVDSFLTDPQGYYQAQFFSDLPPEDATRYVGRPELIARARPGFDVADIARYVTPWTDESLRQLDGQKAYETDETDYGDPTQVLDLVRRLGFAVPLDDDGRPVSKLFQVRLIEK